MLEIRPTRRSDHAAVAELLRRAFDGAAEAGLVAALRERSEYIPELDRVAVDGQAVGHVLLSPVTIDGDSRSWPALALAPVAVVPERQRQGIGTSLIEQALLEARRLGHAIVIVLGHADYYPRFGFEKASRHGIRAPFECADEVFMALELRAGALDGVSGTVVYPAPFANL